MKRVSPRLEQEISLLHTHICEGLGDPKRVLILYLLADGPCNVSELTEALKVSQPTVSHHLKVLRDRGLVRAEREGTSVYYSLTDFRIIEALDMLRAMLADILTHRASLMSANGIT
ncbi:MAG TPA: ArsR family transcriptional regulator [Chloroflexi bacterium]|nr:ArsR family transcriptional regulator [Chloroflexota bacterium]